MEIEQMTNDEMWRELKMLGTLVATGQYEVLEKHETAKLALLASVRLRELHEQLRNSIPKPVVEFIDDTLTVNGKYVCCADADCAMNVYDNLDLALKGGE